MNVNDLDSYGYEAAYDGSFAQGRVRAGLSMTAAYSRKKTAASDSELLPSVAAHLRLHPAITGKFPGVSGLSYRLVGSFDTATRAPYVVGPNRSSVVAGPTPQLAPVDRARLMLGFQYDFGAAPSH